jgi:hypothetical protein
MQQHKNNLLHLRVLDVHRTAGGQQSKALNGKNNLQITGMKQSEILDR